jgi:hypothetical protein
MGELTEDSAGARLVEKGDSCSQNISSKREQPIKASDSCQEFSLTSFD